MTAASSIRSDGDASRVARAPLPRWLQIGVALGMVGTLGLAGRLGWEQTVWSWERGPQMVGYSLAHRGSGILLMLSPLLLIGCLVVAIVLTILSLVRRRRVSWWRAAALAASAAALIAVDLPYGFWQRLFIARLASSPHAAEFFVYDAAVGDLSTVRALVAHGVPVDARDRHGGQTALQAAAAAGRLDVIEFVVAKGADVNAVDRNGDSALERALAGKQEAAARWLAGRGAVRMRGDEARRRRVAREMDREVGEEMEQAIREAKK